jgi:hypothetical protein
MLWLYDIEHLLRQFVIAVPQLKAPFPGNEFEWVIETVSCYLISDRPFRGGCEGYNGLIVFT